MYLCWGLGLLPISGYALAEATWQLMVCSTLFAAGMSAGMVVWATLMQSRVPAAMLGRVTSLDWLVSIGLTPVSFAITAPIASLAGPQATLLGAGILGCAATLGIFVALPALREDEQRFARAAPATTSAVAQEPVQVVGEAGVADVGGLHPHDLHPFPRR